MAIARTDTYDQRAQILGGLIARNRVVAVLRIVVPLIGIGAFLVLAGQIYLSNLMRQYGVSGIRIDRGNVVVEAPRYSGTGTDGSHYLLTATEARTPIGKAEEIAMSNASLEYGKAGGGMFFATAAEANMNTASQVAIVTGITSVTSNDGLEGTLIGLEADMGAEIIQAHGPVDLTLGDGTTITGSSMIHDGKSNIWTFIDATVVMQDLPEAEEP
jgi:lipopolysaccharide export system protein LptC